MGAAADGRPGRSILVLSAADVDAVLPPHLVIESQRRAFRSLVDGDSGLGSAAYATDSRSDALVFTLTGLISRSTGLVGKIGVQLPANPERGLPNIHAAVLVFDPDTGVALALLDGGALTTLRTAAGLAAAADALAPGSATTLGVLGSGPQARAAVRMIAQIRDLEQVALWSPSAARRDRAVHALSAETDRPVRAAASARDVVTSSEIVAICTRSREPVLRGDWLAPGQTVLTIGSYAPDRREIDLATTARARTFVDLRTKSRALCGPVIEAIAAGILRDCDLIELGTVITDPLAGRRSGADIVIFHSLGVGVQDAAAGWLAYEQALRLGRGQRADW